MDSVREEVAELGPATVLELWLDASLMESLRLSEEVSEEERSFRLEAARIAIKQLAPKGAGLEERMVALAFVVSHAAGLDHQAWANSRYLSPDTRRAAQRQARAVLALANRQLALLLRLRAERAKALDAADQKARIAELDRRWRAKERAFANQQGFAPPAQGENSQHCAANPAAPPATLTPDERRSALERLHKLARNGLET